MTESSQKRSAPSPEETRLEGVQSKKARRLNEGTLQSNSEVKVDSFTRSDKKLDLRTPAECDVEMQNAEVIGSDARKEQGVVLGPDVVESPDLESLVKSLRAQLEEEKALRKQLARQYGINPDPNRSILDALPLDLISMILKILLVKSYPLHLNHLLVFPDSIRSEFLRDMAVDTRGETSEADNANDDKQLHYLRNNTTGFKPLIVEKSMLVRSSLLRPKNHYEEIWDIINTCRAFRQEGLKVVFSLNEWVINPVWSPSGVMLERYWCTKTNTYQGSWIDRFGEDCYVELVKEMFGIATVSELRGMLAKRPLQKQEYMMVPKSLVGLEKPLELIRHIRIGIPMNAVIPSDAAHFLRETLRFVASQVEFGNINTIIFDCDPDWRTGFHHGTSPLGSEWVIIGMLRKVLKQQPIWFKGGVRVVVGRASEECVAWVLDAVTLADSPGTKSVYKKGAALPADSHNEVVFVESGLAVMIEE